MILYFYECQVSLSLQTKEIKVLAEGERINVKVCNISDFTLKHIAVHVFYLSMISYLK